MDTGIVLHIDHRECHAKTLLPSKLDNDDLKYVFENLDCGDFIIKADGRPIVVFERKTTRDLLASIIDGRYRNQKQRMVEAFGRENIVYIIEGSFTYHGDMQSFTEVEHKSLKTSIMNTQLRDKIAVMRTQDVIETCALLHEILIRVSKDTNKYVNVETQKQSFIVQHPRKKESGTKSEVFIQQLCQISGISQKTAEALCNEFIDMKTFYETLSSLNSEQKLKLLKNIYLKDNRRINSKVAERILHYMF
jgi:ERCC4-type nuclease